MMLKFLHINDSSKYKKENQAPSLKVFVLFLKNSLRISNAQTGYIYTIGIFTQVCVLQSSRR